LGTKPVATETDFTQGDFSATGNSLDLVIQGQGFFQIKTANGDIAYTRNGNFHLSSDGKVVDSDGDSLEPQISIPADQTSITVGTDGTVSVMTSSSTTPQQVGRIELARFQNPAGLDSLGKSLFKPTQASGDAVTGNPGDNGTGALLSGYVEQSNVSVVEEMVNMIVSQRAYEANSKVIRTADDMFTQANNVVR
jgi:flagellar basal-body rod protein FlgG